MKNLVFFLALLCSTGLVAQFNYNANGSGIQSPSNTASGTYSTAMGDFSTASGRASTAMGADTTASGVASTAMGVNTEASGTYSTAMGGSTVASGNYSTASGVGTTAEDYFSFVIGAYNKTDETPNPDNFSYQNTAFVIGNGGFDSDGSYDGHLSNAFEVLFDGTTTIAGDLNINSDARLKANIISLGATLSKLLQIDGKTYTMRKDANHKKKIGLLAQDIEKVFPELVTETNDIKSVNYQGLVPVLINAMKEQQDEIERLKKQEAKLNKQQQKIDELEVMVKQLMTKQ
jgi:cell division protein ZapA (FtsZ GTPase activity inhibitor)